MEAIMQLPRHHPRAAHRQRPREHRRLRLRSKPVLKLFTPNAGATWLISECDPQEPDILYGLCDPGLGEPELGTVSLAEIEALRGPLGLPVERDLYFEAEYPLSRYAHFATAAGRIIT